MYASWLTVLPLLFSHTMIVLVYGSDNQIHAVNSTAGIWHLKKSCLLLQSEQRGEHARPDPKGGCGVSVSPWGELPAVWSHLHPTHHLQRGACQTGGMLARCHTINACSPHVQTHPPNMTHMHHFHITLPRGLSCGGDTVVGVLCEDL